MLDIALRRDGHKVETVNSGEGAKKKLDSALYDVIVTDIKMPQTDGIEVLRYAHQMSPDSAVILITAVDDYEAAVEAVKAGGATDYIRKSPGLVNEIKLAINRALEKLNLSRQNFAFKREAVADHRNAARGRAGHTRQLLLNSVQVVLQLFHGHTDLLEHGGNHAFAILNQRQQQVNRLHLRVSEHGCARLRALDRLLRFHRQFVPTNCHLLIPQ